MNISKIGITLTIISVIGIPLNYLVSHIYDRYGVKVGISLISFFIACGMFLPFAGTPSIFILLSALMVTGVASFIPVSRAFISSRTKSIGSAIGFVNTASNAGAAVGPLIIGYVYDLFPKGSPFSIISLSLLAFFVAILLFFIARFEKI